MGRFGNGDGEAFALRHEEGRQRRDDAAQRHDGREKREKHDGGFHVRPLPMR